MEILQDFHKNDRRFIRQQEFLLNVYRMFTEERAMTVNVIQGVTIAIL